MKFNEMDLSTDMLKSLEKLGFDTPTEIQEKSLPILLSEETDIMGVAQTGTGKTAAFAIPIIEKIDPSIKAPQALIICPTRELCIQITRDIMNLAHFSSHVKPVAVYGGASIVNQLKDLGRGANIVIATPGRLMDIINRKKIKFDYTRMVVLDEADEMLNMGFKEDINDILKCTPEEKNTWLFTATMPKEIRRIASNYMKDPIEIQVSQSRGNDNIEHQYYLLNPRDRYHALKRLVDFSPEIFAIVFCRTKRETKDIAERLIKDGYNSDALHGDLSQAQRDVVMNRYREKNLQILVATDVAARGIDVNDVTHVINFALPDDVENYTHRSGRTARAGKKGISICLVSKSEQRKIAQIERKIGKKFVEGKIPNGIEICENQLKNLLRKVKETEVNQEQLSPYMDYIIEEFSELSREEILMKLASMEFNKFLKYYKNAKDLVVSDRPSRDRKDRKGRNDRGDRRERGERSERRPRSDRGANGAEQGFNRYFINVGEMDRLRKGDLVRMICDASNINGSAVGRIEMKDKFSFVEIESDRHNEISNISNLKHNGREVRMNLADAKPPSTRRKDGKRKDKRNDSNKSKPKVKDSNFLYDVDFKF